MFWGQLSPSQKKPIERQRDLCPVFLSENESENCSEMPSSSPTRAYPSQRPTPSHPSQTLHQTLVTHSFLRVAKEQRNGRPSGDLSERWNWLATRNSNPFFLDLTRSDSVSLVILVRSRAVTPRWIELAEGYPVSCCLGHLAEKPKMKTFLSLTFFFHLPTFFLPVLRDPSSTLPSFFLSHDESCWTDLKKRR